jgi:DNA-directed RNA polymerase specialized sigma54-like protein
MDIQTAASEVFALNRTLTQLEKLPPSERRNSIITQIISSLNPEGSQTDQIEAVNTILYWKEYAVFLEGVVKSKGINLDILVRSFQMNRSI